MNKKCVFFDIDGTIWDMNNHIPESTVTAIRALRAAGHYAFLCSGRTRAYITNPSLFEIGFDGIVAGCGTLVEINGEQVYYHRIDKELACHTLETIRRFGFRPILEGKEYLYFDDEDFGEDFYGQKVSRELGNRRHTIKDEYGEWEISKISCATDHSDTDSCFAALSEYYDYFIHTPEVVEIVPKGHTKATGIQKVCERLGVDRADTFAFGDSVNDLDMLRFAGIGVAMGNGSDIAKEAADYVTSELHNDGIYNALKHFSLI